MSGILSKKVAKVIPVWLILLTATLVSASVLTYYATIQASVTVNSAISVSQDGENWQDAPADFELELNDLQAGDVNNIEANIYVRNNANRPLFTDYKVTIPKDLIDGTNNISFSYVEYNENGTVVDERYGIELQDTLVIDVESNTITSENTGNVWDNALQCDDSVCYFDFAEVIEPSIIYGKSTVKIHDIAIDLKPEALPGEYDITIEILPVEGE